MGAIKGTVVWFGRKALLYGIIVAALLASAFLVPWIKTEWTGPAHYLRRADQLEYTKKQLDVLPVGADKRLSDLTVAAKQKSTAELNAELKVAQTARANAMNGRRSNTSKAISLAKADTDALLADGQVEVEIQVLDGEIKVLTTALQQIAMRRDLGTLGGRIAKSSASLIRARSTVEKAKSSCRAATERLDDFNSRWSVRLSFQLYDRAEQRRLSEAKDKQCKAAGKLVGQYKLQQSALNSLRLAEQKAGQRYRGLEKQTVAGVTVFTGHLTKQILAERTMAEGSWAAKMSLWAKQYEIGSILRQAAILLGLIVASPFLIRLVCYFVLAPIAMRRGAIRLRVPGGSGTPIPLSEPSATSLGVRLAAGDELLVRQDYLQSTSQLGRKGTQWALDCRKPLTSFATGLTFLTRIRGDGEITTVSAIRDPFAEVAIITLPAGASCVLHPRALAAVAQPIQQHLRVTSHWQIFSLNAWLTMQLRYLVFHGPARLVVKGGRGVRVERAEQGRTFGQDQLVGFSADLSYSVTRTETFWPYFLGREQLLKDHVAAGEGVLIIEEAPMAGRLAAEGRRGIEGMVDAGMKVFGM